jgi:LAGLIDADG endonuclease
MTKEQFSFWFSGFIDAEGNFQVFLDRKYLRVMFRIRLHKDDILVLYKIKEFLGIGNVKIENNSCLFVITDKNSLNTILFPLLDKYNLYTTKWLDYIDFKSVVNYLLTNNTTIVSDNKLIEINAIIKNMNLTRTSIDYSLIPAIKINPFWLLGFIEGEGTFGSKNLKVLQSISLYLHSLPKTFLFSLNTLPPKLFYTLDSRTLVSVISITNIDALYDYFIYFLLDLEFQTRKGEDFYYWCLLLHLHKYGYFYTTEGKILVFQIAKYINDGRYTSNSNKSEKPDFNTIQKVLSMNLPIKLAPEMLHVDLAKAFAKLIKNRNIWVYDNGVLINSQPFTSFSTAMKAIGYSASSVAARRTLDTGKFVNGRYTFYSFPLNTVNN